jgi:hypothetical protein
VRLLGSAMCSGRVQQQQRQRQQQQGQAPHWAGAHVSCPALRYSERGLWSEHISALMLTMLLPLSTAWHRHGFAVRDDRTRSVLHHNQHRYWCVSE